MVEDQTVQREKLHPWAHGLRKGDEHPAYTPHDTFYLLHGESLEGRWQSERGVTHTHTRLAALCPGLPG